jgi:hypothetical protein
LLGVELVRAGVAAKDVYVDRASGAKASRPELVDPSAGGGGFEGENPVALRSDFAKRGADLDGGAEVVDDAGASERASDRAVDGAAGLL